MRGIIKKILPTWVIVTLFFFPLASGTTNAADAIVYVKKEFILDIVARQVARAMFQLAINRILEKIQTGINGAPALVQNWRNFQTLAQYRGEDVFRVMLANTQVCNYLQNNINNAFRVTARYRVQPRGQNLRVRNMDPYALTARCSMASNFNPQTFSQDFARGGGWQAYLQLLQPENNFYGLYFQSLAELEKQRALEEQSDLNEARGGYRSIRAGCEQPLNAQSRCIFLGRIGTPADLVAKTAGLILDKKLEWLTNADEISEVSGIITSFIWTYFENLATASPEGNSSYVEDQEKMEYCTAERPARSILNKYRGRFDPYGLAARGQPPCGSFDDEDDLKSEGRVGDYAACVQNCLRAVGVLPSELPVPSLRGPTPPIPPTPRPSITPRPSGSTPPSSCQPEPNGCFLNTPERTCVQAEYRNEVNAAIDKFIRENPDVFQDPGSQSPFVKTGREQEYMNGVVANINAGGGLQANVESGDEIAVRRPGGTFIEGYDILTSGNQVRRAHVSTCPAT